MALGPRMWSIRPRRGEVWLADLDPVRGHEQAGRRPVLVVSVDPFNSGPSSLIIAIPLTTKDRKLPSHILVAPPQGGVKRPSFAMTEAVRSLSKDRLIQCWGMVGGETMAAIESWLRTLMGL